MLLDLPLPALNRLMSLEFSDWASKALEEYHLMSVAVWGEQKDRKQFIDGLKRSEKSVESTLEEST